MGGAVGIPPWLLREQPLRKLVRQHLVQLSPRRRLDPAVPLLTLRRQNPFLCTGVEDTVVPENSRQRVLFVIVLKLPQASGKPRNERPHCSTQGRNSIQQRR